MKEFLPTVQENWDRANALFHSTSTAYMFSKKLKALKPVLKQLSRDNLSAIQIRVAAAYTNLCDKQQSTLVNPCHDVVEEEKSAYKTWDNLADIEEGFLKQKSKMHWLDVGDKNNKFFYNAVQNRTAKNSLWEIYRHDGTVFSEQEDIKREAVIFFEDFLTEEPADYEGMSVEQLQDLMGFRCTTSDTTQLLAVVTEAEVKNVLFSMPRNKSPGPDGYTVEFFMATWSILGKDFVVAIQSFFRTSFLPKGMSTTILALLPKQEDSKYRKISGPYHAAMCCTKSSPRL